MFSGAFTLVCVRFHMNTNSGNSLIEESFTTVCVCVRAHARVCVCLQACHFDVIGLGIKVDQGILCIRHYITRSNGKPLKGPSMATEHLLSHG